MSNVQDDGDLSPYIQVENLDPKWLAAIGYEESAKEVEEAQRKKRIVEKSGVARTRAKLAEVGVGRVVVSTSTSYSCCSDALYH